jgi:hypothetical protein
VRLCKKTRAAAIRARMNGNTDYSFYHDVTVQRPRTTRLEAAEFTADRIVATHRPWPCSGLPPPQTPCQ